LGFLPPVSWLQSSDSISVSVAVSWLQASMMGEEEWDRYLHFLHSIALADPEASKGLHDVTEAACKRVKASQAEASLAHTYSAAMPELPSLPPPPKGEQMSLPALGCALQPLA